MKQQLSQAVRDCINQLYGINSDAELTRPDEKFGDYATNIALRLSKQLGRKPREIAEEVADRLRIDLASLVSDVTIAGPGFINLVVADTLLVEAASRYTPAQTMAGQIVVAEYSDPNPFKILHAGHLYTSIVGDAIASLVQAAGADVHRVNFGGDVGLHVAKTMWSVLRDLGGTSIDNLAQIPADQRSEWMARCYIAGTDAYAESSEEGGDSRIKADIHALNKIIYDTWNPEIEVAEEAIDLPTITEASQMQIGKIQDIYKICRQWSYDYFDEFYARIGTRFEKYYPESRISDLGLRTVTEHIGSIFEESEGAVIFRGEQHGLFDQVFITSKGIPAYSAKDVGLIMQKYADYKFDCSIIITGSEQLQYMSVVLKAIEQFAPELSQSTTHMTHGMVKLAGGVKMSSRKGNILRAVDVLDIAAVANKAASGKDNPQVVLGAVKYAFLKQRLGSDIIYDPDESVSLQGNSGPYLQYAHARARSILAKAPVDRPELTADFEPAERSLMRKITEYPEALDAAVSELMPHHICSYLYELAQVFNSFYEHNRVMDHDRQGQRLALVAIYADTLKNGLELLSIPAPQSM